MTQNTTTKAPAARVAPRRTVVKKPEAAAPAPALKHARRSVTAKAAEAPKSVMQHVAGAAVKFFVFVEGARPVSGVRLAAHTDAALRFLGLAGMEPVRKNAAVAVMGNRAVKYHLGIGNMKEVADAVKLTQQGYNFFKGRVEHGKVDGKLSAAFLAAISKGKTDTALGIKDNHLIPVGMNLR